MFLKNDKIQKIFLAGGLLLLVILLLRSFALMPVDIDESWLGEQAYFLAKEGYVKSNLFEGLLNYEKRLFVFHKGFVLIGALAIRVFGFDLLALRSVSLLMGLFLFAMLFVYLKGKEKEKLWLWSVLFLLLCPLVFRHLKFYRPEVMLAATGFSSFVFLDKFLSSQKIGYLLLSGLFSGISILVHLNGLMFLGAGSLVLLRYGKFTDILIYGLSSFFISSFYFFDLRGHWSEYIYQFKNDPSGAGTNLVWYQPLLNLCNEHKRLFRKPEIIGITVLAIVGWLSRRKLSPKPFELSERILFSYTTCLICFLGLIAQSKTTKYAIPLFPFFTLIAVLYLPVLWQERKKLSKPIFIFTMILLVAYITYGFQRAFISVGETPKALLERNVRLAKELKANARVLGPMNFVFGARDDLTIVGTHGAQLITRRNGNPWEPSELCHFAKTGKFDFVILDEESLRDLCDKSIKDCFQCSGFEEVSNTQTVQLFKRTDFN